MPTAALQVTNLHIECAKTHILSNVSLYAMSGEIILLLGHNNSGRRATLRAITGQTENREGSVRITGQETIHHQNNEISHLGVGMLPTYGGILPHLTCEENLLLPDTDFDTLGGAMSLTQIYELCPDLNALRNTLGTGLSVAEKRMLAIARMLRTGKNVLLMDDVSDGLSPIMMQAFSRMFLNLKKQGYTLILGVTHLDFCLSLADRFYVIENGRITDTFRIDQLPERDARLRALFSDNSRVETH